MNSFLTVVLDSFENEKKRLELLFEESQNFEPEKVSELAEIEELKSKISRRKGINKFDSFLKDNEVFMKKIEVQSLPQSKQVADKKKSRILMLKQAIDKRSLLVFEINSKLRSLVQNIINSELFNKLIYFFIFLSMINSAVESFLYHRSNEEQTMSYKVKTAFEILDYIAYSFFIFEVWFKVIANGYFFGSKAFLKEFYNVINFLGVLGFLIKETSYIQDKNSYIYDISFFLKALLPLRILEHYKKLQVLALSLKQSLDQILNVARALLIVW